MPEQTFPKVIVSPIFSEHQYRRYKNAMLTVSDTMLQQWQQTDPHRYAKALAVREEMKRFEENKAREEQRIRDLTPPTKKRSGFLGLKVSKEQKEYLERVDKYLGAETDKEEIKAARKEAETKSTTELLYESTRQDFEIAKITDRKKYGWLGNIEDKYGYSMTELSVSAELDGKEIDLPLLVPTLNDEEIEWLRDGQAPTQEIINKAIKHAEAQMAEGKSPFLGDQMQPPTTQADIRGLEGTGIPMFQAYEDKLDIAANLPISQFPDRARIANIANEELLKRAEARWVDSPLHKLFYLQTAVMGNLESQAYNVSAWAYRAASWIPLLSEANREYFKNIAIHYEEDQPYAPTRFVMAYMRYLGQSLRQAGRVTEHIKEQWKWGEDRLPTWESVMRARGQHKSFKEIWEDSLSADQLRGIQQVFYRKDISDKYGAAALMTFDMFNAGVDLASLSLSISLLADMSKLGTMLAAGIKGTPQMIAGTKSSAAIFRHLRPETVAYFKGKAQLYAMKQHLMRSGLHAFFTTKGDMANRFQSGFHRMTYTSTPWVVANLSEWGINPTGYMAILTDFLLNSLLTAPTYREIYKEAGGLNIDFLTMAIPQFTIDLAMSLSTRGNIDNETRVRILRDAKQRWGKNHKEILDRMVKERVQILQIKDPNEIKSMFNDFEDTLIFWDRVFGDKKYEYDFNYDMLNRSQKARYNQAVSWLRNSLTDYSEQYALMPKYRNMGTIDKALDTARRARNQLEALEKEVRDATREAGYTDEAIEKELLETIREVKTGERAPGEPDKETPGKKKRVRRQAEPELKAKIDETAKEVGVESKYVKYDDKALNKLVEDRDAVARKIAELQGEITKKQQAEKNRLLKEYDKINTEVRKIVESWKAEVTKAEEKKTPRKTTEKTETKEEVGKATAEVKEEPDATEPRAEVTREERAAEDRALAEIPDAHRNARKRSPRDLMVKRKTDKETGEREIRHAAKKTQAGNLMQRELEKRGKEGLLDKPISELTDAELNDLIKAYYSETLKDSHREAATFFRDVLSSELKLREQGVTPRAAAEHTPRATVEVEEGTTTETKPTATISEETRPAGQARDTGKATATITETKETKAKATVEIEGKPEKTKGGYKLVGIEKDIVAMVREGDIEGAKEQMLSPDNPANTSYGHLMYAILRAAKEDGKDVSALIPDSVKQSEKEILAALDASMSEKKRTPAFKKFQDTLGNYTDINNAIKAEVRGLIKPITADKPSKEVYKETKSLKNTVNVFKGTFDPAAFSTELFNRLEKILKRLYPDIKLTKQQGFIKIKKGEDIYYQEIPEKLQIQWKLIEALQSLSDSKLVLETLSKDNMDAWLKRLDKRVPQPQLELFKLWAEKMDGMNITDMISFLKMQMLSGIESHAVQQYRVALPTREPDFTKNLGAMASDDDAYGVRRERYFKIGDTEYIHNYSVMNLSSPDAKYERGFFIKIDEGDRITVLTSDDFYDALKLYARITGLPGEKEVHFSDYALQDSGKDYTETMIVVPRDHPELNKEAMLGLTHWHGVFDGSFGWYRYDYDKENPDIMRAQESQSDLMQRMDTEFHIDDKDGYDIYEKNRVVTLNPDYTYTINFEHTKQSFFRGERLEQESGIKETIKKGEYERAFKDYLNTPDKNPAITHAKMFYKTWEQIQLLMIMHDAARQGLTAVRLPTGETAYKIQNYERAEAEERAMLKYATETIDNLKGTHERMKLALDNKDYALLFDSDGERLPESLMVTVEVLDPSAQGKVLRPSDIPGLFWAVYDTNKNVVSLVADSPFPSHKYGRGDATITFDKKAVDKVVGEPGATNYLLTREASDAVVKQVEARANEIIKNQEKTQNMMFNERSVVKTLEHMDKQTKYKAVVEKYENELPKRLAKLFGDRFEKEKVTDSDGNTWWQVKVDASRDLNPIMLQKDEYARIIGMADVKAMAVLIDTLHQRQDTLPHEYAHNYISWHRDTPLVQEGIRMFGSEEKLVEQIGIQVVKQQGNAFNWWKKFTNWIIGVYSKEEVLQVLTDSFLKGIDLTKDYTYSNKTTIETQKENNTTEAYNKSPIMTGKSEAVIKKTVKATIAKIPAMKEALGSVDQTMKDLKKTIAVLLSDEGRDALMKEMPKKFRGMLKKKFTELTLEEYNELNYSIARIIANNEIMKNNNALRKDMTKLSGLQMVLGSISEDRASVLEKSDQNRATAVVEDSIEDIAKDKTKKPFVAKKWQKVYDKYDEFVANKKFKKLKDTKSKEVTRLVHELAEIATIKSPHGKAARVERSISAILDIYDLRLKEFVTSQIRGNEMISFDDAYVAAMEGFAQAIPNWDKMSGASVWTYASQRARYAILDMIGETKGKRGTVESRSTQVEDITAVSDREQSNVKARELKDIVAEIQSRMYQHKQDGNIPDFDFSVWDYAAKKGLIVDGKLNGIEAVAKHFKISSTEAERIVNEVHAYAMKVVVPNVMRGDNYNNDYEYRSYRNRLPDDRQEEDGAYREGGRVEDGKTKRKRFEKGRKVKKETNLDSMEDIDNISLQAKERMISETFTPDLVKAYGLKVAEHISEYFGNLKMAEVRVGAMVNNIQRYLVTHNMPQRLRNIVPFMIEGKGLPKQLEKEWGKKKYARAKDEYQRYMNDLKPLLSEIEKYEIESFEKLVDLWPTLEAHQKTDYVGHLWRLSRKRATSMLSKGGQYTTSPFTKKRIFDTLVDGMEAGRVPRHYDICDILKIVGNVNARAMANKRLSNTIKSLKTPDGERMWKFSKETPSGDWVSIPHRNLKIPFMRTTGFEYRKQSEKLREILKSLGVKVVLDRNMEDTEGRIHNLTITLGKMFEDRVLAHELGHVVPKKLNLTDDFYNNYLTELLTLNRERIDHARLVEGQKGVDYTSSKEELFAELFATIMMDTQRAMEFAPEATKYILDKMGDDATLSRLLGLDFNKEIGETVRVLSKTIEPVEVFWHPAIAKKLKLMYAPGIIENSGFLRLWRNVFGTSKSIVLKGTLLHPYSMSETASANIRKVLLRTLDPGKIYKFAVQRVNPLYEPKNKELVDLAAKHGLNFGTSADYNTATLYRLFSYLDYKTRNVPIANQLLKSMSWGNKAYDDFVWNYLQPSFKLYTFEMYKKSFEKKDVYRNSPALMEAGLRQAAQIVNDCYGGQNWAKLGVNKATQDLLDLAILAPDYNMSITRQFLSVFGIGAKAGYVDPMKFGFEPGSKEYKEYLKMSKRMRMKMGMVFGIKVARSLVIGLNLFNATMRYVDYLANPEFYDDEFGNSILDYTMFFGNPIGLKDRLFVGRDGEGRERYLAVGKQFRDPIRIFWDIYTLNPRTIGGKMDFAVQAASIFATGYTPGGYQTDVAGEREAWKRIVKVGKEMTRFMMPIPVHAVFQDEHAFSAWRYVAPMRTITEGSARWQLSMALEDIFIREQSGEKVDVEADRGLREATKLAYQSFGQHTLTLIDQAERMAHYRIREATLERLPDEIAALKEELKEAKTPAEIKLIEGLINNLSRELALAESDIDVRKYIQAISKRGKSVHRALH